MIHIYIYMCIYTSPKILNEMQHVFGYTKVEAEHPLQNPLQNRPLHGSLAGLYREAIVDGCEILDHELRSGNKIRLYI